MPSIKPPQKQENPLDRLADGPDKTPMEKHELEDIDESGQEAFEKNHPSTLVYRCCYLFVCRSLD